VEMAGAIAEIARMHCGRNSDTSIPPPPALSWWKLARGSCRAFPTASPPRRKGVLPATGRGCDRSQGDGYRLFGVSLSDGKIAAAAIVWAAGVRAESMVAGLPCDHDPAGRAQVGPDLSLPAIPEIFVIGDAARGDGPDGSPVPGIAPAAKQMGAYVGGLIARRLAGRSAPPPFATVTPAIWRRSGAGRRWCALDRCD